ncbi:PQQ-dependent dehydrogenase, methanol/ethanol family [Ketobacter sp.]|uniref:PQQ-dependent dehydrogenase, methanol/ethanol family n=1 Tax=Ketobacter sp. TaxID=2083498 RepID=UPI000F2A6538|nr:PQQ-dependent dehydrogenase, methanol/ethanol family [Ketobacter sp.]RLU00143.1 MAG: PQQ-dependent dehydrogenase, methanol/ethanol family [Ketobacter sp.]
MRAFISLGLVLLALIAIWFFQSNLRDPVTPPHTADGQPPATPDHIYAEAIRQATASVDGERILNADSEPNNWLAHGRTYDESRFSPLDQINTDNVHQLGLAWSFDFNSNRGLEATPIVVDGIMFSTAAWSKVYAHDARNGTLLWEYDPQVPKAWGAKACCDAVNRGAALWEGKVYVGTLDGYLVALEAATGKELWKVNTIDRSKPYTITGAPRVVKGKVIIGNGGAEYGVRGYVTAYDASTGKQAWRFYTVPGNPADGFESDAMARAAQTWTGEWWQYGGGGTAWDSMAYDPELDLLYVGTGNGSVWNRSVRSPEGGDNLYLSSIVALKPDSGEYVWHYQTTPGDSWDYTATQHMILADLNINGSLRKVIMQAPKNGFFYVLDRRNGQFISANNYVPVTWATHIDPETGRPVETANARYQAVNPLATLPPDQLVAALKPMSPQALESAFHKPSPFGGHNWHPMSYNPQTGLVYIPALDIPYAYGNEPAFEYQDGRWNIAINWQLNAPTGDAELDQIIAGTVRGHIAAWDPVAQEEKWRVQHAGSWNGGILSTAGNLIFQGTSHGQFAAYNAETGAPLWSSEAQTGVVAPPITYSIDGEQYVSVVAGWGGVFALAAGEAASAMNQRHRGRILTYKLGGTATLPPLLEDTAPLPALPASSADAEQILQGKVTYHRYCGVCHGPGVQGGGVIPDLRFMGEAKHSLFNDIVLGGILKDAGMVSFADVIDAADAANLQAYIIAEGKRLRESRAKN